MEESLILAGLSLILFYAIKQKFIKQLKKRHSLSFDKDSAVRAGEDLHTRVVKK